MSSLSSPVPDQPIKDEATSGDTKPSPQSIAPVVTVPPTTDDTAPQQNQDNLQLPSDDAVVHLPEAINTLVSSAVETSASHLSESERERDIDGTQSLNDQYPASNVPEGSGQADAVTTHTETAQKKSEGKRTETTHEAKATKLATQQEKETAYRLPDLKARAERCLEEAKQLEMKDGKKNADRIADLKAQAEIDVEMAKWYGMAGGKEKEEQFQKRVESEVSAKQTQLYKQQKEAEAKAKAAEIEERAVMEQEKEERPRKAEEEIVATKNAQPEQQKAETGPEIPHETPSDERQIEADPEIPSETQAEEQQQLEPGPEIPQEEPQGDDFGEVNAGLNHADNLGAQVDSLLLPQPEPNHEVDAGHTPATPPPSDLSARRQSYGNSSAAWDQYSIPWMSWYDRTTQAPFKNPWYNPANHDPYSGGNPPPPEAYGTYHPPPLPDVMPAPPRGEGVVFKRNRVPPPLPDNIPGPAQHEWVAEDMGLESPTNRKRRPGACDDCHQRKRRCTHAGAQDMASARRGIVPVPGSSRVESHNAGVQPQPVRMPVARRTAQTQAPPRAPHIPVPSTPTQTVAPSTPTHSPRLGLVAPTPAPSAPTRAGQRPVAPELPTLERITRLDNRDTDELIQLVRAYRSNINELLDYYDKIGEYMEYKRAQDNYAKNTAEVTERRSVQGKAQRLNKACDKIREEVEKRGRGDELM